MSLTTTPWKPKEKKHWRGDFVSISGGISSGKGQPCPMRFHDKQQDLVDELLANEDVQRIAAYQSCEPFTSVYSFIL